MTQEDKELLLKDLCARLPYGVKVLYHGWDSDHGCEFSTVEDLIGIDDRFICTLWRGERDKHSIVEPLSIIDYKPYLRPMSSMTEEEILELYKIAYDTWYSDSLYYKNNEWISFRTSIKNNNLCFINCIWLSDINKVTDYLNKKMFDYRGLIEKGLAIEVTEENNPYKD